MTLNRAELEQVFQKNEARYIEQWKEFLRIPSVSTDPAHEQDCRRCAEWLVSQFSAIGFESKLLETPTKPTVYAHRKGRSGSPHVLFYGHYDVQPPDPLDLWKTPPFEPTIRDGRMYARGAEDNKGQVFYVLKALEYLMQSGQLNATVSLLIEGEEESGSEGFIAGLPSWKDKLDADILMVCDTGSLVPGVPAITMGLRSICHLNATLKGLRTDLHSGVHGGMIRNPATEIARLVATLHNPDGSIAVEGFYEGVNEPDPEDRELANRFPITPEQYKAMTGVEPLGGEKKYTPLERRGFRPCIDINGLGSGYQGPGVKTIIPSAATAKISARLVAGQNPERCAELIERHLKKHAPPGLTLEIERGAAPGKAVSLKSSSPLIKKARDVLVDLFEQEPLYMWEGASIPVVSVLAEAAGAEPLLVGFGLEEDNIHAPNESFGLSQLRDGFLYASMMLGSL